MSDYTKADLTDALKAIGSSIRKIEKVRKTLSQKQPPPKSQLTLASRNLKALRIAEELITRELNVGC